MPKLESKNAIKTMITKGDKTGMKITAERKFYFVTTNTSDGSVIHHGYLDKAGQDIYTGQPSIETYDTETEYKARLTELNVKDDYSLEEATPKE